MEKTIFMRELLTQQMPLELTYYHVDLHGCQGKLRSLPSGLAFGGSLATYTPCGEYFCSPNGLRGVFADQG